MEEDALWRKCERAWSKWLQGQAWTVMQLCGATGSAGKAPLMEFDGIRVRAPDLMAQRPGATEYWEVKYRSHAERDMFTGDLRHWMEYACFVDYLQVARATNQRVWIILYEDDNAAQQVGRWLRIDVRELGKRGMRSKRVSAQGTEVDAWLWPVTAMEVVAGPDPRLDGAPMPVFPNDSGRTPAEVDFDPFERDLRAQVDEADAGAFTFDSAPIVRALRDDRIASLDVLRRTLGIPALPRYSVLRVSQEGVDLRELLGLLHYGIRVFLVTNKSMALEELSKDAEELQAFIDARLLEVALVSDAQLPQAWVIDGDFSPYPGGTLDAVLEKADRTGGINLLQYHIVHSMRGRDVLVRAGAGTGKTETMAERLMFMLATSSLDDMPSGDHRTPGELALDEVAMVTFTKEAAREMRRRIALTITLRQRLCRRCVLPTLAWMMQLGRASISTIHGFAQRILQVHGNMIGIAPDFTVSAQTIRFREVMHEELTKHVAPLYKHYPQDTLPIHLWQRHIESVWRALEGNGVRLIDLGGDGGDSKSLEWGNGGPDERQCDFVDATRHVLLGIAERFGDICLEEQSIPVNQLVPCALASLSRLDEPPRKRIRALFIDEFQDTDPLQMQLMLTMRKGLGANLFVVGDQKQGIYRFRGAEGSAFDQLAQRVEAMGLPEFLRYSLTRNFRSTEALLDSIHPFFLAWGKRAEPLLDYGPEDKLRFDVTRRRGGEPVQFTRVRNAAYAECAARVVAEWRRQSPEASIAVLCRRNFEAQDVCAKIREHGDCDLWQGGDFYRSRAVRELRVLLQALSDPSDDAALLELAESLWMGGIASNEQCPNVTVTSWDTALDPLLSWHDRFASLADGGRFAREDLEPLRDRVQDLAQMLERMSAVACVVECIRVLAPQNYRKPGDCDEDQRLYLRCIDRLITLVGEAFGDAPVTLARLLSWLQIQIATNRTEDTPFDERDVEGRTVALTVHKAKGLQFDYVIVPHTWAPFGPSDRRENIAAVLDMEDGTRALLWRWKRGDGEITNVVGSQAELWAKDAFETDREEARLLYVAMTRAKQRLVIQRLERDTPRTWGELLAMGER